MFKVHESCEEERTVDSTITAIKGRTNPKID